MLVHQILKAKGDTGVVTVKPGTGISEVAQILAERRIGGVVVSSDGKAAEGIISERDIVRALGVRGAGCMEELVDDLMIRNPVCGSRNDSADDIMKRMTEGRFRHMPITDNGVLVGIVTIGDVVAARLDELAMERNALEGMIMGH
ncbi:CBS domain-containing protein [Thalassobius sp. MITS945101]|uniref:CBS domain-containing protein n=1 Tax=Thalassobius sp. MITS945101 TaxID=3096994 RepID=UPI00399C2B3A